MELIKNPANLQISYRKETHHIEVDLSDTLISLKERIGEIILIPPSNQKLMYKKTNSIRDDDDASLWDVGIRDSLKILVIGSTSEQIEQVKAIKNEGTFERQRSKYAVKSSAPKPKKTLFDRIQAKIGYL
jgi:non-ribosomal peptide synthetase component E (peptide arylation enzyme)